MIEELQAKELRIKELLQARPATPDISDTLWKLGYDTAVPGTLVRPLKDAYVVGEVTTMLYLPQRRSPQYAENKLNHSTGFKAAKPGQVVVMVGDHEGVFSILGGNAAKLAVTHGIAACLIDGGVRDVQEILETGLAVWARGATPKTARYRLELFQINGPVAFCGVQVRPGDVAIADPNGICFVPSEVVEELIQGLQGG
jgi:4-hydroxy-4-methyl-2-oxoglutarate aldolase